MIETAAPVEAAETHNLRARPAWAAPTAALLGLLGVGFRGWLTLMDAPPTNSDEATMGLAAMHIAAGRDLPIFFYGQQYMGTIEAYLAAPLVGIFGPSTLALRIPTLACYVAFLVTIYMMTRRLYSPGLAVLTVGLLAFGADRIVKNQLIAGGGYPEISPIAVLLILIAAGLGMRTVRRRSRGLAFAAWGLLAGLAVWDHWLVLPYLAAAAAVLFLGCGRELRGRAGLIVTGTAVLGAAPLLIHNLTEPFKNNSIAVFLHLNSAGTNPPLADRLDGGVLSGLPLGTGLCSPSVCEPWQRWWAPVYLGLLMIAAILAVRAIRATGRSVPRAEKSALNPDRVRQAARLALLGAAALSLLSYARSPAAADSPVESARYLGLLLVSTPAVLWPLWTVVSRRGGWSVRSHLVGVMAAAVPIIALIITMFSASLALARQAPAYRQAATGDAELTSAMDRLHVTAFYTGYWTCNRLAFATGEKAVCAVLGDDLRPGFNRYLPYRDVVAAAEAPAYIAPVGSPFDARVADHLTASRVPFQVTEAGGHRIYLPTGRIDPPV